MDPRARELLSLSAKPPDEILKELSALRDRQREGEDVRIPPVTLFLRTGSSVTGSVLKVAPTDSHGRESLLFQLDSVDPSVGKADVMFLSTSFVEAVVLHDVRSLGAPPQAVLSAPKPSLLDIKRRMAALRDETGRLFGAPVPCEVGGEAPEGETALRVLADLAEQLAAVVASVAAEDIGRAALKGKLRRVVVSIGKSAEISFKDGVWSAVASADWNARPRSAALRRCLEEGL